MQEEEGGQREDRGDGVEELEVEARLLEPNRARRGNRPVGASTLARGWSGRGAAARTAISAYDAAVYCTRALSWENPQPQVDDSVTLRRDSIRREAMARATPAMTRTTSPARIGPSSAAAAGASAEAISPSGTPSTIAAAGVTSRTAAPGKIAMPTFAAPTSPRGTSRSGPPSCASAAWALRGAPRSAMPRSRVKAIAASAPTKASAASASQARSASHGGAPSPPRRSPR